MGIINVTPDSFSGDGFGDDVEAAVAQGLRFVREGADLLDVGGESSRPLASARVEAAVSGRKAQEAERVSVEEELRRVVPVIEGLSHQVEVPISVDTTKVRVAEAALRAGASIINDVWGLRRDPALAQVAAAAGAPLVLMHNQVGIHYEGDVVERVMEGLAWSRDLALQQGVPREHIILDPGFGFGKTPQHNLELLSRLSELRLLGHPLLLGASRKSTIGRVLGLPVEERLEGTAATVALAIAQGMDVVRVHDVRAMVRVARMSDAVVRGWSESQ
ncbi:MAG: dihydropteroate synthase [Dehalococcoidia bacterium]|nr:dihydropteroate synthase [Dehalococcoidia bacterium]